MKIEYFGGGWFSVVRAVGIGTEKTDFNIIALGVPKKIVIEIFGF